MPVTRSQNTSRKDLESAPQSHLREEDTVDEESGIEPEFQEIADDYSAEESSMVKSKEPETALSMMSDNDPQNYKDVWRRKNQDTAQTTWFKPSNCSVTVNLKEIILEKESRLDVPNSGGTGPNWIKWQRMLVASLRTKGLEKYLRDSPIISAREQLEMDDEWFEYEEKMNYIVISAMIGSCTEQLVTRADAYSYTIACHLFSHLKEISQSRSGMDIYNLLASLTRIEIKQTESIADYRARHRDDPQNYKDVWRKKNQDTAQTTWFKPSNCSVTVNLKEIILEKESRLDVPNSGRTGPNWIKWQRMLVASLRTKGLEKYLRDSPIISAREQLEMDDEWFEYEEKMNNIVISAMIGSCTEQLVTTADAYSYTIACHLYSHLKEISQSRSGMDIYNLLVSLTRIEIKQTESIADYRARHRDLVADLREREHEVDWIAEAGSFLKGLAQMEMYNSAYTNAVRIMIAKREFLNMKDIVQGFLLIEERGTAITEKPVVLAVANERTAKKKGKTNVQDVKCYACGKKGHYSNKCPEKKKGTNKPDDDASVLLVRDDEVCASIVTGTPIFLVDSGADMHVCPDRERFITYEKGDGFVRNFNGEQVAVK